LAQKIAPRLTFLEVAISSPQPFNVTVNFAVVSNSTATNPAHHNFPRTGSAVIPANTRSVQIPFKAYGDTQANKEKTLGIQLAVD
jgi:hypothetical protein